MFETSESKDRGIVKSQSEIQKRLKKLKFRYLKNYLKRSQDLTFENCIYGFLHQPSPIPQKPKVQTSSTLVPKRQVTLVILDNQEEGPAPLCMYGSDNPESWPGEACLGDRAATCPMFKPRLALEDARDEFIGLLEDDEYVYDNMKDIAALQWAINERIAFWPLSIFERITIWFMRKFFRRPKLLPPPSTEELSEGLWDDTP